MEDDVAPMNALVLFVHGDEEERARLESAAGDTIHLRAVRSDDEALEVLASCPVAVVVKEQAAKTRLADPLLEQVRARWPATVRVVICSHNDLGALAAATRTGMVARFLQKPWVEPALRSLLRWSLGVHRLRASGGAEDYLLDAMRLDALGSSIPTLLHEASQPLMGVTINADYLRHSLTALASVAEAGGADAVRQEALRLCGEAPGVLDDIRAATVQLERLIKELQALRGA